MKIYKVSNYILDDFTLSHLEAWISRVIPDEEAEITKEKMLNWIDLNDPEEVKYAMDEGWRRVYDLANGIV